MANTSGTLTVRLLLDDTVTPSESRYVYSGPNVLTLITALPAAGLACTLTSVFVTPADTAAHVVHVLQGPVGHASTTTHAEHERGRFDDPRACAYEHLQHLIEVLGELGHTAAVQLADDAFVELEAVE